MMNVVIILFLLLIGASTAAHAQRIPPHVVVITCDVVAYDLTLDLDFDHKEIRGTETITALPVDDGATAITLDAAGISPDELTVNSVPCRFASDKDKLRITLASPARRGDTMTIAIRYRARPALGLKFDIDQAYTAFHTERWMVCNAEPVDKATLSLHLILPDTLTVAASGRMTGSAPVASGRARHDWSLDIPTSSYLFGFAAGPFNDTTVVEGGRAYRYVGAATRDSLVRIFAPTREIFDYYTSRAGIVLPESLYTQVLLHGNVEQEASGMALLRESYAGEILEEPREDWLLAHEAAHQWWGNMVTCASWSEIWLNEGFATFMTAAFKEMKWGREEYDREIAMARLRLWKARKQGYDRPLTFETWTRPTEANGVFAYYKGAGVLHYLRYVLGDSAFWSGIREYTRARFGSTATAEDLQRAMEHASGKKLDRFFNEWVASPGVPELVAEQRIRGTEIEITIEQRAPRGYELPMQVALETTHGRASYRVVIGGDGWTTTIHLPFSGELLSVRIDDGGNLPVHIDHLRPFEMLLYQIEHEPDVAGRVDALLEAELRGRGGTTRTEKLVSAARKAIENDSSRLVRQIAAEIADRLTNKE
jgi:aminopeptidase N